MHTRGRTNDEINSTHRFCTGEIVPYLLDFSGCPEGECRYENSIFRPDNRTCGYIMDACQQYPECTVTIHLGMPEVRDGSYCEFTVPDHCIEPYVASKYVCNGTWIQGNDLCP